ncbi:hypothetical protein ACIOYV_10985 [Pseudomonas sp. NPDC087342]
MQTTGQVECKWVVKSTQLRNCDADRLEACAYSLVEADSKSPFSWQAFY